MKLILIHGNAASAISRKIAEIRKGFDSLEITEITGKETDFSTALIKLSTGDLFSSDRLVVMEQFDDKIDIGKISGYEGLTVVLRFNKLLTETSPVIKKAREVNAQIIALSEKDEVSVFPFLDALADRNVSRAYNEFEKLYPEYGGQYLLTMIYYLFRKLITRPKKAPQFVLDKLNRQKKNFDKDKIRELYKEGLETDYRIKSGSIDEKLGITLMVNKILAVTD